MLFFFFFHLLNFAKAVILNAIGKHTERISSVGEMCARFTSGTAHPADEAIWPKCWAVQVSVVVLTLKQPIIIFSFTF